MRQSIVILHGRVRIGGEAVMPAISYRCAVGCYRSRTNSMRYLFITYHRHPAGMQASETR